MPNPRVLALGLLWAVWVIVVIGVLAAVGIVAGHFIAKFW